MLTGARTDAPRGGAYAQRQNLDWIESVVAAQRERDDARSEFAGLFTAARGLLR